MCRRTHLLQEWVAEIPECCLTKVCAVCLPNSGSTLSNAISCSANSRGTGLSQWLASLASCHDIDPAEDSVCYNRHVLRLCSITATKLAQILGYSPGPAFRCFIGSIPLQAELFIDLHFIQSLELPHCKAFVATAYTVYVCSA